MQIQNSTFSGTAAHNSKNPIATDFERIFHPRRIAIIGVSADKKDFGFGTGILKSLKKIGYEGTIYPVNPKGGEIEGLSIYQRIEDIPEDIDFAIIAVAAKRVPEALEACLKKGAAGAEILSSGFKEVGTPEGDALDAEICRIAQKGIRVIGPNCFGIYCPKSGLTILPGPDLPRETGSVAFTSQSGGMSVDFAHMGKWMGLRFSKVVSFGNGADLRETELLQYLGDDPETRVISMYVEGIKNGESFFNAIKSVARKKPVIVCKGGLSAAGHRAVVSHTASMGGSKVIWGSILEQVNAVQVYDMVEMAQASLAFSLLPEKVFERISVVGGGGALGIAACDAAETFGIAVPSFLSELKMRIENFLPKPGSSAANPVDVANPFVPPTILKEILRHAAEDERIDLQMMISLLYHYKSLAISMGMPVAAITPCLELADAVSDVAKETGKPIIMVLPNTKRGLEDMDVVELIAQARRLFIEKGIPVFDEISDALRAVGHVNAYYRRRKG